eukprot:1143890-Pelagomonas_calceolata.AAC.1
MVDRWLGKTLVCSKDYHGTPAQIACTNLQGLSATNSQALVSRRPPSMGHISHIPIAEARKHSIHLTVSSSLVTMLAAVFPSAQLAQEPPGHNSLQDVHLPSMWGKVAN